MPLPLNREANYVVLWEVTGSGQHNMNSSYHRTKREAQKELRAIKARHHRVRVFIQSAEEHLACLKAGQKFA